MNQSGRKTAGAILWAAALCALHIVVFRSKVNTDIPVTGRLLSALFAVAVTLPLHELAHCAFMKLCGLDNVRIEFGRDPLGIPSLRASAAGKVHGAKRLIILLSPFLLLTILPDILFVFSGSVPLVLFISSLCNAAGCYFDAADAVACIKENGE